MAYLFVVAGMLLWLHRRQKLTFSQLCLRHSCPETCQCLDPAKQLFHHLWIVCIISSPFFQHPYIRQGGKGGAPHATQRRSKQQCPPFAGVELCMGGVCTGTGGIWVWSAAPILLVMLNLLVACSSYLSLSYCRSATCRCSSCAKSSDPWGPP